MFILSYSTSMYLSGDEFFGIKFPDVSPRVLRMVTVVFKQGLQLPKIFNSNFKLSSNIFLLNSCYSKLYPTYVLQGTIFLIIRYCAITFCVYPIPIGEGGGGGDSALLQIVFFITSVRDAVEPRNLVTFPKI